MRLHFPSTTQLAFRSPSIVAAINRGCCITSTISRYNVAVTNRGCRITSTIGRYNMAAINRGCCITSAISRYNMAAINRGCCITSTISRYNMAAIKRGCCITSTIGRYNVASSVWKLKKIQQNLSKLVLCSFIFLKSTCTWSGINQKRRRIWHVRS